MKPDASSLADAQAFARVQWPLSAAVLRPLFVTQVVDHVADWVVRVVEHDRGSGPSSTATVTEAFFTILDKPASLELYDTGFGADIQREVTGEWLQDVVRHMAEHPWSEVLTFGRSWMHAESSESWAELVASEIATDEGRALRLHLLSEQLQESVINEVGRLTLAEISKLDDGGAGRRLAVVRDRQALRRAAAHIRELAARAFYEERWPSFYEALGMRELRRLEAEDLPAVVEAVQKLGWSQRERWLFAEGSDCGSFSRTVADWFDRDDEW